MSNILQPHDANVPRFTLSLPKFLFYLIKSNDKMPLDLLEAQNRAEHDKNEQDGHVQVSDLKTGEVCDRPFVWHIKDWKSSYLKYQLDKERANKERKEANLLTENRDLVLKALANKLGLNINDPDNYKLLKDMALKIARVKNDSVASKTLGITIDKGA